MFSLKTKRHVYAKSLMCAENGKQVNFSSFMIFIPSIPSFSGFETEFCEVNPSI